MRDWFRISLAVALLAALGLGCTSGDTETKLDNLNVRMTSLEDKLDRIADRLGADSANTTGPGRARDRSAPLRGPSERKLDDLARKLAALEKSLENQPAGRPSGPRPPRPDPDTVYSVSIDGSPFEGAKDAKVTIVEAFEFA